MATTTIYADRIQIIDELSPDTAATAESITGSWKKALVHFTLPTELQYKAITNMAVSVYTTPVGNSPYIAEVHALLGAFGTDVTYNTAPAFSSYSMMPPSGGAAGYKTGDLSYTVSGSSITRSFDVRSVLNNGIGIQAYTYQGYGDKGELSTSLATNPPYLVVTYEDSEPTGSLTGSPRSGYAQKNQPLTLRANYSSPSNIAATLTPTQYAFYWRPGTSGSYTKLYEGPNNSYEVPANTFTADTVQWYAAVWPSHGSALASGLYTLSTVEPVFSATAISPDSTLEDGSAPITFIWTASNSVGSTPSGAELQYSTDGGSTWTTFDTVTGSALEYEAPANTIPGGTIQWRVRALTNNGTAGEWSSALSFLCIAAPAAPTVSTDAAPFATFTWSAEGQQAYEVTVDGVSYGVQFGTAKAFTLPQPLADGEHSAEVRIQGEYGLWSQPGSVSFTVTNAPAGTVTLEGSFGIDADLFWTASPAGDDFLIFRDGVQIGHTAASRFSDRRAVGSHSWEVLLRQADGNYTRSNTFTGTLTAESPVIGLLSGGEWLTLRLTETSLAPQTYRYSRVHTLRHFSGAAYPVLELTPYEDLAGTLQVAFADDAQAAAFEALRGQVVIYKHRDTVLTGGLTDFTKARNPFYVAYQFTIDQIATEEVLDDTDG